MRLEAPTAERTVEIKVNEHPVTVGGPRTTGVEIKQAAIEAGVKIGLDFVLSEEVGPRQTRIVGDHEVVTVRPNSRFVAVAPDDNS